MPFKPYLQCRCGECPQEILYVVGWLGQCFHQDQSSICLRSKVRDHATLTFKLLADFAKKATFLVVFLNPHKVVPSTCDKSSNYCRIRMSGTLPPAQPGARWSTGEEKDREKTEKKHYFYNCGWSRYLYHGSSDKKYTSWHQKWRVGWSFKNLVNFKI